MSAQAISDILARSASVKLAAAEQCSDAAFEASRMIATSLRGGGKLMLCGNGGSAGDAQHLAAEFVATLDHQRPRPGLAAIALTTDTSFITAYSNDFGFDGIFSRQVETLGQTDDVLIGISTSGNSKTVVAAMNAARAGGIGTIAFSGEAGGEIRDHADIAICVPSRTTMHIQEAHIALGHVITILVEQLLGHG